MIMASNYLLKVYINNDKLILQGYSNEYSDFYDWLCKITPGYRRPFDIINKLVKSINNGAHLYLGEDLENIKIILTEWKKYRFGDEYRILEEYSDIDYKNRYNVISNALELIITYDFKTKKMNSVINESEDFDLNLVEIPYDGGDLLTGAHNNSLHHKVTKRPRLNDNVIDPSIELERRKASKKLIDFSKLYQNRLGFIDCGFYEIGNKALNQFNDYKSYYFDGGSYKNQLIKRPDIINSLNGERIIDRLGLEALNSFKYYLMYNIFIGYKSIRLDISKNLEEGYTYYRVISISKDNLEKLIGKISVKNALRLKGGINGECTCFIDGDYYTKTTFKAESINSNYAHVNITFDAIAPEADGKDSYYLLYHVYIDNSDTVSINLLDTSEYTPLEYVENIRNSELNKLKKLGFSDIDNDELFLNPFEVATTIKPGSFDDYRFTRDDNQLKLIDKINSKSNKEIHGTKYIVSRRIITNSEGKLVYED